MLKLLVIIILILFLVAIGALILLNPFQAPQVKQGNLEPLKLLYTKYKGDYKKITDATKRLKSIALKSGIASKDLKIVIFFFDPEQVTNP